MSMGCVCALMAGFAEMTRRPDLRPGLAGAGDIRRTVRGCAGMPGILAVSSAQLAPALHPWPCSLLYADTGALLYADTGGSDGAWCQTRLVRGVC